MTGKRSLQLWIPIKTVKLISRNLWQLHLTVKLLLKKNIKIAFEMFDINKNGQISKEEFQQIPGKVNPST